MTEARMTAVCPSCGCHQPSGLLCSEDTAALETMLAAVPELVEQLQVAIGKQARIGNAGKGGLARERSPINFGALAVRDALLAEVAIWGDDINELRRAPWSPKAVAGIGRAVKDAYRCIDRTQDRKYLGTCLYEEDGATCHAEIWARPGAHQVTCSQCDCTHEVGERRDWLLRQAEDMIVTPREAARYIGEVGGITVGHQRIRNYLDRGRIATRPTHDSVKRLRLGDLLAVLLDETARHDAKAG